MSLTLIITGVVCLLLFSMILVLVGKSKKEKQIKFLYPLHNLAQTAHCSITRYDIWNDSVIGIDDTRNFVFAIRKTKEHENTEIIDLTEVFRCRVAEISRTSGPKEGNIKIFDRIDLVFTNKNKSKAETSIEFYNSNTDRLTLAGELQLAEKWCILINNKSVTLSK